MSAQVTVSYGYTLLPATTRQDAVMLATFRGILERYPWGYYLLARASAPGSSFGLTLLRNTGETGGDSFRPVSGNRLEAALYWDGMPRRDIEASATVLAEGDELRALLA